VTVSTRSPLRSRSLDFRPAPRSVSASDFRAAYVLCTSQSLAVLSVCDAQPFTYWHCRCPRLWPRPQIIVSFCVLYCFFYLVEISARMTIYKPKPGEKKADKKSDTLRSTVRIPEDVVRTRFASFPLSTDFS